MRVPLSLCLPFSLFLLAFSLFSLFLSKYLSNVLQSLARSSASFFTCHLRCESQHLLISINTSFPSLLYRSDITNQPVLTIGFSSSNSTLENFIKQTFIPHQEYKENSLYHIDVKTRRKEDEQSVYNLTRMETSHGKQRNSQEGQNQRCRVKFEMTAFCPQCLFGTGLRSISSLNVSSWPFCSPSPFYSTNLVR